MLYTDDLLNRITALPQHARVVRHSPETPRYGRARTRFDYLLRAGALLGVRRAEPQHGDALEIAVWARPGSGRGFGYYACLRLYFEDSVLVLAMLFCYYDGTESSPGFRSLEAAAVFARAERFLQVQHEAPTSR